MSELDKYLDTGEITAIRNVAALRENNNEVRALQDLLFYAIKGIAMYAHQCRNLFVIDRVVDRFVEKALGKTFALRSVEANDIVPLLTQAVESRGRARVLYEWASAPFDKNPKALNGPATYEFDLHPYNVEVQAQIVAFEKKLKAGSNTNVYLEDVCLMELNDLLARSKASVIKGLSGDAIYGLIHQVLDTLAGNPDTAELNRLADHLSNFETEGFQETAQRAQKLQKSTSQIEPNPNENTLDSSELRPTLNIRVGEKGHKLGHSSG